MKEEREERRNGRETSTVTDDASFFLFNVFMTCVPLFFLRMKTANAKKEALHRENKTKNEKRKEER